VPNSKYRRVDVAELTLGSKLAVAVFDQNLRKLLHAGATIDDHVLEHFQARGITSVLVEGDLKANITHADVVDEDAHLEQEDMLPITRCGNCRASINLLPPLPEMTATAWRCNSCGVYYFGSNEQSTQPLGITCAAEETDKLFAVGPNSKQEAQKRAVPTESAQRLAKLMMPEDIKWADRRQHKRYPITVPVLGLPLAADFRVDGEPIALTTANVSLGGASLLHHRFVNSPHLAIDFSVAGVDQLQVVFKVLRCQSLGLVYAIGGKFLSRLTHTG